MPGNIWLDGRFKDAERRKAEVERCHVVTKGVTCQSIRVLFHKQLQRPASGKEISPGKPEKNI